jgi:two-component system phosphate regulon sensor histidine kinase PhoR
MATVIVNKLRERDRQLEESNRMLAEQDRMKSRYVMTVSHDLQGSLAAIQSYLKLLSGGYTGPVPEKPMEIILRAEKRCDFLLKFVQQLLDLSQMRAERKMRPEPISLTEMIDKEVNALNSRMIEKQIEFRLECNIGDDTVFGDVLALEQLFDNLLSNAVKYSRRKGSIVLSINEAKDPQAIEIVVSDTGIGIPAENLNNVFEDFFRAGNAKEAEQGTGLGLSIVKRIVETHRGRIRVESELNEGTRFIFTLPRAGKPNDSCGVVYETGTDL